ncbi:hypothetical protein Afil01_63600 [Actinorhabdospora filicis]|uniref:Mycothiol-dependent maleylpyruvate isomerase metal-binding domain-containing protein n=1 Tax=Actinorhabdospora filicis TaxID=1785913 RepID=A0A9W6ST22_9ACTN|nr:maleylpyruvate isomerase N-terminal domain-containing protein [Actinorhabdospora filicis]GLZ81553.1 hypothetical protein Afil01_63600 [Actinorhabdospora filicis]
MTPSRRAFLAAARDAARLLRDPAVAAAWERPSALAEFGVSGLAGHTAYQVTATVRALAEPEPTEPLVSLMGHYERVAWIGAPIDAAANVGIREGGEELAAQGPAALSALMDGALAGLASALPDAPARRVRIPLWGAWSLGLDDFLLTRAMELAVHADDLAVSAGLPAPEPAPEVAETVVVLLTRLSTRRHGALPLIRALSRRERAPETIAAF